MMVLTTVLIGVIVAIMLVVGQIQGTARVVNYAGLVRGETQRIVKLENAGLPQDGMIDDVTSFIAGLRFGSNELQLVRLNDVNFQNKMAELSDEFETLKKEIQLVRTVGYHQTDIIQQSEDFFAICDEATGLAAAYSQRRATILSYLENVAVADIVALVALIALQSGEMSMEAVGVYLAGYLFSSLGAFGVVSLMSSPYRGPDADSLFSYRGLFWHRPILSAVMTVMMLSLAGIPMTLGFIGKFYVLAVGVHAHLWWLVAAVVVGSAIGLYYYLRVAVSLYLSAPEQLNRDAPSNWQYSAGGIVVLISALLVLVLGIWPQPLISIVQLATPLM